MRIDTMFKKYKRKQFTFMRPYIPGEDMTGITYNENIDVIEEGGMIAMNPQDHNDKWYVNKPYFEHHFELIEETEK